MPQAPTVAKVLARLSQPLHWAGGVALVVPGAADDAAFMGPAADGRLIVEFDREAPGFTTAVVSALEALRSALPDVRLLRVRPEDIVSLSAIAARTGCTDESVRLLAQGRRGPGGFPPAVIGCLRLVRRVGALGRD